MMTSQSEFVEIPQNMQSIWDLPLIAIGCNICGQAHLVSQNDSRKTCPNCGSVHMKPQSAMLRQEPPELYLPFAESAASAKKNLGEFQKKVWLAPDDFTADNLLSRLTAVYLPMWLVDCTVNGQWKAGTGFNYQIKSSQENFHSGDWHTKEIIKTRIRWELRAGTINRTYNNVSVPAFNGYTKFIAKLGKFNLGKAIRYESKAIIGSFIRIPDLSPENAWPIAKDNLNKISRQECEKAVSADHIREFAIQAKYNFPHWTQLLLPIYFTWYKDEDDNPIPVYIHGQTGKIAGPRFSSQRKGWKWAGISALIAVGLFLLSLLSFAGTALLPFLSVLGIFLAIFAFLAIVFAVIPAVYPWQWNRQQQDEFIVDLPAKNTN
jgi:hypothetical protein